MKVSFKLDVHIEVAYKGVRLDSMNCIIVNSMMTGLSSGELSRLPNILYT